MKSFILMTACVFMAFAGGLAPFPFSLALLSSAILIGTWALNMSGDGQ